MIYEFAVSPAICDSWQNLRFLLSSFGKEEGRLLSDIPKKQWFNLAMKTVKQSDNPQKERKVMTEGVIKLKKKSLYKRNFVPAVSSANWLDHALTAHHDRPFRAILTTDCQVKENYLLTNNFELTEQDLWKISPGCMVKRTAGEMLESIKPMLDCANEVILIDRNFDPGKRRFVNFLAELLTYLANRTYSPSIQTVSYHMGDKMAVDHIRHLCDEYVTHRIPSGISVNICVWPNSELHDRYVLTDNGGVKYGIGLDEHEGVSSREVAVNRIFETEYRKWWAECQKRPVAFTISRT